ncbi:unnamed protein product [Allacma fusca]|uniref:Glomulin n=1 Tax=Allacma fusca TaxID=39272 RepID=A0A8J2L9P0_9HEXA|nr:unnamed protein product [Allacma fusca]
MGLMDTLEQLFLDGDYERAKLTIMDEENDVAVNSEGMNLMGKVFDAGLRPAFTKEQITASKEILCHITSKMSPKEALITLLEQIEVVCLENKLYCVMDPLRIALDKLPCDKWGINLKWVLEVLTKRFQQMVFPTVTEKEGVRLSSKILAASEAPDGPFWTDVYNPVQEFLCFYEYCVDYVYSHFDEGISGKILEWKNMLKSHVLSLLGYPLAFCPFEYPVEVKKLNTRVTLTQKVEEPKDTVAVGVGIKVVELLDKLDASAFTYHSWLERSIDGNLTENLNRENEEAGDIDVDKVDLVALASYFNLVYGKNLKRKGPSSPTMEIYTGFHLASSLLENKNVEVQFKALKVVQLLLNQLCPVTMYHRLSSDLLETSVHLNFISKLSHVLTYSDHNDIRRLGASIFKSYMWAFDSAGRYKYIKYIFHSSDYSDSVVGFVITQLKEFARQGLEKKSGSLNTNIMGTAEPVPPEMEIYFTGKHLHSLIQHCLELNNGPQTDLVACDGQVLSALNLIRFLLMRDGKTNISGIVDYLPKLNMFFKNVRQALDMTVLQTRARLKELNDPSLMKWEAKQAEDTKCEMFLKDTEGVQLSYPHECSIQEQVQSCKNILTKMDLMECVLVHTTECYESITKTLSP